MATIRLSPPDGVSAFVARVLDQLTVSAWLPAALLTVGVAILLQFRGSGSVNVLLAVMDLTRDPVLVIMIPLLVLATVVTQAFAFEAIRTLEGYWSGPASLLRTLMIRWHVRRRRVLK
ncbi:MAG TPA: hypothetical protein VFQ44_14190, partial [Streptosporangiaceae bacterium]|nr:hypothetical protein [Streptosporangiaceae bacterium]